MRVFCAKLWGDKPEFEPHIVDMVRLSNALFRYQLALLPHATSPSYGCIYDVLVEPHPERDKDYVIHLTAAIHPNDSEEAHAEFSEWLKEMPRNP